MACVFRMPYKHISLKNGQPRKQNMKIATQEKKNDNTQRVYSKWCIYPDTNMTFSLALMNG